jgi:hypothetical protein
VLDGPAYDAVVHAAFLGFTLSMIMAHAPVILPAVLRVRLPYRPAMYAPVLLLHTSLVVRTLLGDARGLHTATEVGGLLNAVAVLLFIGILVWSAARPAPRPVRRAGPASSSAAPLVSAGAAR